MDRDERVVTWPVDLEAVAAKNVRALRESRGLSQKQLGLDLLLYGAGMSQATVAMLEDGAKPLRLNEVAAIAAFFAVPVEALWQVSGEILKDRERASLLSAAHAAEVEEIAADYYRQQRIERLRDK